MINTKNLSYPPVDVPEDLKIAIELLYRPIECICHSFAKDRDNTNYGAIHFSIDHLSIKFRIGKITPTKLGQFITLWKRAKDGKSIPYDATDSIDFLVVSVREREFFGQFVFPKEFLIHKGILSQGKLGGKRAMRVYPPWVSTNNRQARYTQIGQLDYFFELSANRDLSHLKNLINGECRR